MEKMQCTNCGASLSPDGTCEYCGSKFRIKGYEDCAPFLIQTCQAPVHRLAAQTVIRHDMRNFMPPEALTDHAMHELKRHIADGVTDYLKISVREDPELEATIIRGEIRVVPPDFRF